MWQRDQSTLTQAVLKIEKEKKEKKNKIKSTVNDLDMNHSLLTILLSYKKHRYHLR